MSEVQLIARHRMRAGTENEVLPLVEQLADREVVEFDGPAGEPE